MPQESVRPINPAPDEFVGDSGARALKRFFHATRPKFFPASVLPVVTGTAFGTFIAGSFDAYVFALALVATVGSTLAAQRASPTSASTVTAKPVQQTRLTNPTCHRNVQQTPALLVPG